jgi:hypothetical protein
MGLISVHYDRMNQEVIGVETEINTVRGIKSAFGSQGFFFQRIHPFPKRLFLLQPGLEQKQDAADRTAGSYSK